MPRRLSCCVRIGLASIAAAGGCVVHTYQPLAGLHRPVVVDPTAPDNLSDLDLTVACVPGGKLGPSEAGVLCRQVGRLFENQGARVVTTLGGPPDEAPAGDPRPIALRLELRSRQIHEASPALGWAAMIASFSLVPALTEFTFAQDVVVRSASGALLATEALEGRITHWFGFGAWASNQLLDWTVRPEAHEVVGGGADRVLSQDLYRQLSQVVFDAKLQARVLAAERGSAR